MTVTERIEEELKEIQKSELKVLTLTLYSIIKCLISFI